MATRTTESTNTLETFRVNFNGVVDDIGNVTVSTAGDQLSTAATTCLLYTSPSPRDGLLARMPSSA